MILSFDRQPLGWIHPYAARRQRCFPTRHPYYLSDWETLARPALDTLSHLFQLADLEQLQNTSQAQHPEKKDKFEVKVDVKDFAPEELNVKMIGDSVIVEGKHEEKQDGQGFISRHFVRRYQLPDNVKPEITCNLGTDGVLILSAPLMIEEKKEEAKTIPITVAEKPAVTEKPEEKNDERPADPIAKKLEEMEDEVIIEANPAA